MPKITHNAPSGTYLSELVQKFISGFSGGGGWGKGSCPLERPPGGELVPNQEPGILVRGTGVRNLPSIGNVVHKVWPCVKGSERYP